METVDEFAASLAAAAVEIDPLARGAVNATGEAVAGIAMANVDVLTGHTRDTISSDALEDVIGAEVGTESVAGPMLERGTATMPARPFLGPAADSQASTLDELLGLAGVRALGA